MSEIQGYIDDVKVTNYQHRDGQLHRVVRTEAGETWTPITLEEYALDLRLWTSHQE